MVSEYLFYTAVILLPVALYSGYRIGKKKQTSRTETDSFSLSKPYFTGLNYLLNEEPDKAIDAFIKMLEVDSETVETHLALGSLFRKRGEVDRAIRVHQNLIARPTLSAVMRHLSLLELGYDYMAAGLYDRAESIFKDLLDDKQYKRASLSQLMIIYQQVKDWEQAISVAEQLQVFSGEAHHRSIAGFYCELAVGQKQSGQLKQAFRSLKKAISVDPECIRCNILRGDFSLEQGDYKLAIKYYKNLLSQNAGFISEVLPQLQTCYQKLGDNNGYKILLEQSLQQGAGISVVLEMGNWLSEHHGDYEAEGFIAEHMKQKPVLKGLLRLIKIHLHHADEKSKTNLQILYDIVNTLVSSNPIYRCDHCGYSGKSLFWQCPRCKHWSSVKPIVGLEGE